MKTKTIIAICAMALVFTNCKKTEKGEPGTSGKDGNANVQSITLTASASSWAWDNSNKWSTASWSGLSILNSNVVDNGAVMIYQNIGSSTYLALPQAVNLNSTIQNHVFFTYSLNTLIIFNENSDLSTPTPYSATYKLVCIPPAIIKSNPNINLNNYNEVKQKLNLND